MIPYLLDTNFFIQANRVGFPMDVLPSFWSKIKELAEEGKIISITKVKDEIYQDKDILQEWCKDNLPHDFFKNASTCIHSYSLIVNWANARLNNPYSRQAIDTFMEATEADAWLVAYAHANNLPLVTHEVSAPKSKSSIKIPDVCAEFGVRSLIPMEMFRELGVKI